MKTTEEKYQSKITNSYYLAYIDYIQKIEGKETNNGFIIWIQKKHTDFRKQMGISEYDRNYKDTFIKWLNQENNTIL